VIAIVGVLVSMLAPALRSARESAMAGVSLSNVRSLQTANALYAEDHDGAYMAGAVRFRTENRHRWHGIRAEGEDVFRPEGAPITAYLGGAGSGSGSSAAVRECPCFGGTLEELRAREEMGFEVGNGGYGYNLAFVGSVREQRHAGYWVVVTDEQGSPRDWFRQPSRTIAFSTSAFASAAVGGVHEYSFAEPRFWPENPTFRPDPTIHFRCGGGAPTAWLDGSASIERRTFSWAGLDPRVDAGEQDLGWFGEADDNRLFDYD
jgi:hypothetical protein